jgi:hypothetical protein
VVEVASAHEKILLRSSVGRRRSGEVIELATVLKAFNQHLVVCSKGLRVVDDGSTYIASISGRVTQLTNPFFCFVTSRGLSFMSAALAARTSNAIPLLGR